MRSKSTFVQVPLYVRVSALLLALAVTPTLAAHAAEGRTSAFATSVDIAAGPAVHPALDFALTAESSPAHPVCFSCMR